MKAMIFAAGLGTRLKPMTDQMPKALVPISGKPLIQHVAEKLHSAGFDDIVVNVHHFADMLEGWCRENLTGKLSFSDERAQLLETGGGIKHAQRLLCENNPEGRFLVHNVDILSNVDLQGLWKAYPDSDAVLLVSERQTQRYLIFDTAMKLVGWTNVKTGEVKTPYPLVREAFDETYTAPVDSYNIITSPFFRPEGSGPYTLLAFAGIHVINTDILRYMKSFPDKFSIIDFYLSMCSQLDIRGVVQPELRLMDVGKIDTLSQAEEFVNL